MGKYFKEEETSNRIKRFKTSDFQEKSSRFAQVSRVYTKFDKFLDWTKTVVFQAIFKAPALLKVKPQIVTKLKDGFIEITRAKISLAAQEQQKIQPVLDEIQKLKTRQEELQKSLAALSSEKRNVAVQELEEIRKKLITEEGKLKPLKEELAKQEKTAIEEINALIQDFNRENDLASPLSWNENLSSPKIEFLFGTAVSKSGTGSFLNRGRQKQQLTVYNFINQFRRGAGKILNGILTEQYSNALDSIGFFDKKYKFKISDGGEWKDIKYSMSDLFELINNGGFNRTIQKPLDNDVKAKIIEDFKKFNEQVDKIERGMLSPLGRSAILALFYATPFVVKNTPAIATLPQTWQRQQDLRSKTKMPKDMQEADRSLGIGDKEKKQIAELERLLLTPNLSLRARRSLERSIKNLKGGN